MFACDLYYQFWRTEHTHDLFINGSINCAAHTSYCANQLTCMWGQQVGVSPVTEDSPLGARGSDGQLEGCVEVVLLLVRAVDHLPSPHHEEARVSQVGRVQLVTLPVQNHNASCAATCGCTHTHTCFIISNANVRFERFSKYNANVLCIIGLFRRTFMAKLKVTARVEICVSCKIM